MSGKFYVVVNFRLLSFSICMAPKRQIPQWEFLFYYYYFTSSEFFIPTLAVCISLSNIKSFQAFRTLLSIQADLINAIVWMVSIRSPISKSLNPLYEPLGTASSVPFILVIIVTLMFHSFLCSLARSEVFFFHFRFCFIFTSWSTGAVIFAIQQFLFFFFLISTRPSLLVRIRWFVCISKYQRILCITFSYTDSGLCIYHLVVWSKFQFLLHSSQWIIFPHPVVPRILWVFLLHSTIMWLIILSLSPLNIYFLFCCVLSGFVLT